MNNDLKDDKWPQVAGSPKTLGKHLEPPSHLEERVVNALNEKGLLRPRSESQQWHLGWLTLRASLAAAACVTFLAIGVFLGRSSNSTIDNVLVSLVGDETDLYAILLYETADYSVSGIEGELTLYEEYNQWVAMARQSGQFVTGEDLEVDRGWLVTPAAAGPEIREATAIAESAPLSGIFFIRSENENQALELARELPHVKHGGQVLVQKTIPTINPPASN